MANGTRDDDMSSDDDDGDLCVAIFGRKRIKGSFSVVIEG